jgi:hypothetical protein
MDIELITFLESVYLLYMYFIYKTNYSFNSAIFDKQLNSMGSFFVHNTNVYQNKICQFGKFMAIIAVILAWIRVYYINHCDNCNKNIIKFTIIFDVLCATLAGLMNLNALIYIIPLFISEIYIIKIIDFSTSW